MSALSWVLGQARGHKGKQRSSYFIYEDIQLPCARVKEEELTWLSYRKLLKGP